MKCEYISSSRLDVYEECTARYAAKYDQPTRGPKEVSDAMNVGSLVHLALEYWYGGVPDEKDVRTKTTVPEGAFEVACKDCEVCVTNFPDYAHAKKQFLDTVKSIDRDKIDIIEPEYSFKHFLDSGVPVTGRIDIVAEEDNGETIHIIDFKTGKFIMSRDEMYDCNQPNMYAMIVDFEERFEGVNKIKVSYFYTREQIFVTVEYDRRHLELYKQYLLYIYKVIINDKEPRERMNKFCWSCPRMSECTAVKNFREFLGVMALNDEDKPTIDAAEYDMDQLAGFWQQADSFKTIFENVKDHLSKLLLTYMQELEGYEHDLGGITLKTMAKKSTKHDFQDVYNLAQENRVSLKDVFKVDNGGVKKAFKDIPTAQNELESKADVAYGKPYIMQKKKSGAAKKKNG